MTDREGWPHGVDLLLGRTLADWVLEGVRIEEVGVVWTEDEQTAWKARGRGFDVRSGSITRTEARFALSVHYPRILATDELDAYEAAYNIHPGWLPWGRGYYPYLWAIVNDEPPGATIHRMTPSVDAGPFVDRARAELLPNDTARSLIARIRGLEQVLFRTYWPRLVAGEQLPEQPQPEGGSYHAKAEAEEWRGRDDDRARRAFEF